MSSFFFQAEDGIRDYKVTGVQTCALPIFRHDDLAGARQDHWPRQDRGSNRRVSPLGASRPPTRSRSVTPKKRASGIRSEERRVGKESRERAATCEYDKKNKQKPRSGVSTS